MAASKHNAEFNLDRDGLHFCESGAWRRVCDRIRVVAFAREEQGKDLLVVLRFRDINRKAVELIVPRSELLRPQLLIEKLVNRGFRPPSGREEVHLVSDFLKRAEPSSRVLVVSRTGWVDQSYVRPQHTIGRGGIDIRYVPYGEATASVECGGDLAKWQRQIADLAVHSTRMTFAIALAFAAILLRATAVESGVFHLFDTSAKGKSLLLAVALSVFSRARRGDLSHWDATMTGIEELASAHCDRLLVLDELGHLSDDLAKAAAIARKTSFKIAAGHGRIRSVFFGRRGNRCRWRTLVLSSGEVGISQLARAAGTRRLRGDEVRLIDLPASRPGGHGVFDSVPSGQRDARKMVASIERACGRHFGYPSVKFIEKFTVAIEENMKAIRAWQADFMSRVPEDGWEQRFAKRFALVYAAARLARKFGLVRWPPKWIKEAVRVCYDDARAAVPDHDAMVAEAIENVRRRLKSRRQLVDLRKGHPSQRQIRRAAGFIKRDDRHGTYFLIRPDVAQKWIGSGVSMGTIAHRLRENGHLIATDRRVPTKQVLIPRISKKQRYLCLKREFVSNRHAR